MTAQQVGAEPGPGRQEGHPPRRGLQAEQQHALVELHGLDRAALAGDAEVRLERDGVERHEAVDDLAHLAGRAQQADVGAAVADDGEVLQRRAQDGPHQRHRLAPRPPAADADGHAVAQLGDDVLLGHALVGDHWSNSASRLSTKASRASSLTPDRLSSKVKPCSKR